MDPCWSSELGSRRVYDLDKLEDRIILHASQSCFLNSKFVRHVVLDGIIPIRVCP